MCVQSLSALLQINIWKWLCCLRDLNRDTVFEKKKWTEMSTLILRKSDDNYQLVGSPFVNACALFSVFEKWNEMLFEKETHGFYCTCFCCMLFVEDELRHVVPWVPALSTSDISPTIYAWEIFKLLFTFFLIECKGLYSCGVLGFHNMFSIISNKNGLKVYATKKEK